MKGGECELCALESELYPGVSSGKYERPGLPERRKCKWFDERGEECAHAASAHPAKWNAGLEEGSSRCIVPGCKCPRFIP